MHPIEEVFAHFGGVPALAGMLGVTPQAIYMWGREIPENRAYEIQVLSDGLFRVEKLPVRWRHNRKRNGKRVNTRSQVVSVRE